MIINLPKYKNDQNREGNIIHFTELPQPYCPIANTAIYIHSLHLQPSHYLICKLAKTKTGHNPIGTHKMSASHIRKNFKSLISIKIPALRNLLNAAQLKGRWSKLHCRKWSIQQNYLKIQLLEIRRSS